MIHDLREHEHEHSTAQLRSGILSPQVLGNNW